MARPAPLVAAKRRAMRVLSRAPHVAPTWGGIQDRKTVGTCRGTSGTARRCETACNEGVIADMPHVVVVFLAEERYRWLLRSPPFVRLSQERLASWRGFHHGYRLRRLGAISMAMRALSRTPHVEVVWCSSPRNDIDGCCVPHHSFAFPKKGSHHGGVFSMVIASGD